MIPNPNKFTGKFTLLESGDEINAADEYYNPLADEWLPVEEQFVGSEFDSDESKPVRRSLMAARRVKRVGR